MNLKEKLKNELEKLSIRERDIMRLRLGLNDDRMRTHEEIAELFGISKEEIKQMEAKVLNKSDVIIKETSIAFAYISLLSCIFVRGIWNINSVDYDKLKKDIDEIITDSNFSEDEIKVLNLRFGLSDGYQKTLNEIGEEMNLSAERVKQLESKILRKLRHPNRNKKLKNYLSENKKI